MVTDSSSSRFMGRTLHALLIQKILLEDIALWGCTLSIFLSKHEGDIRTDNTSTLTSMNVPDIIKNKLIAMSKSFQWAKVLRKIRKLEHLQNIDLRSIKK